ncbi:unnamed protein product [Sphenostylis stenocarpa]|uniref:Uncharacterized protein n=1 Tax=Sphenostylis stenocarpa TaxID=92480 RepID=A0AA86SKP1_9FABA|nr:unnamed protein product [Sphenostylis stenocarpa]
MNIAQVTACQPGISVKSISQLHKLHSKTCGLRKSFVPCCVLLTLRARQSFGLKCQPISQSRKPLHICLAGDKGLMGNDDESSPWKSIEKAIGKFKGQNSIEDVLRRQIEKGEYFDSGGGGGVKPPVGGGNSGSGDGSPDGSGDSEDESLAGMWEENLQVFLATLGFIFLYIYIITGEELTKLARDYIKYLFGGTQSVRLKNAMYQCGILYNSLMPTKVEEDEDSEFWLEEAILDTPTWWHDPSDYREVLKNYLLSGSDEAIDIRNYLGLESDEEVRAKPTRPSSRCGTADRAATSHHSDQSRRATMPNKPITKTGKNTAKLWWRFGLAPLKFSSTGYKFPGGPVMYKYADDGGGGQYVDGGFLGEGGGGDGYKIGGGGDGYTIGGGGDGGGGDKYSIIGGGGSDGV